MKNNQTILNVVNDDLCHGCGTCISLCPRSAIELVKVENKGIFLPIINFVKCNKCGICYRVCPGHQVLFQKLNLDIFGHETQNKYLGCYLNCHTGFSSNSEIRFQSSSGGLVTALLIYALESGLIDGALVTRMNKHRALEPEPFIARTKNEIIDAAKSKYCPVPANIALKPILATNGKYAVVGLPCHLHGIRKAESINKKLKDRIVLHLGIFCATGVSFLGTEMLFRRLGVDKTKVLKMDYRGDGWPGNMMIELKENKNKIIIPLSKYSNSNFLAFAPWRCKLCIDHSAELSDISFGDAWLPEFRLKDIIGTSILVTRNNAGEIFIQKALNDKSIEVCSIDYKKVIESQNGCSGKKIDVIARFRLSKIIGKKTPEYGIPLKSCPLSCYPIAIMEYLKNILASNKSTWGLLSAYCNILRFARIFIGKLKQPF